MPISPENRHEWPISTKFPVNFPVSREFGCGDWFAPDCIAGRDGRASNCVQTAGGRTAAQNPTVSIESKAKESEGHATWTDEQIGQFRAHHPVESKGRLAIELILAVAARRGDGISLGHQHLKDGWLVFTQEKNRKRKPVKVETPMPASLAAAIAACPSPPEALTFLTNDWDRPFSKKGFNDWFRKQVAAAGLPDTCVPHGLRKAGCRIMAERDCTPHEIMSVSGHSTLKEVERYTQAADRKRLAARAQAKVAAAGNVVPLAVVGR